MTTIEISFCIQDPPNCLTGSFDPEGNTVVLESTVRGPGGRQKKSSLLANLAEFDALVDDYIKRRTQGAFKAPL